MFRSAGTEAEFYAARGILTHGAHPPGLDYYADQAYGSGERGYCFQLARPLAVEAARVCGLPQDMGWWKAHNFIEMAADLVTYERQPHLGSDLLELLESEEPIASISSFLSATLCESHDDSDLDIAFRRLPEFLQLERVTPETLARKYEVQVQMRHGVSSIDVSGAAKLIERSVELVGSSLDEFLDVAEEGVRGLLEEYPHLPRG